jgi:hypothetical protein
MTVDILYNNLVLSTQDRYRFKVDKIVNAADHKLLYHHAASG